MTDLSLSNNRLGERMKADGPNDPDGNGKDNGNGNGDGNGDIETTEEE